MSNKKFNFTLGKAKRNILTKKRLIISLIILNLLIGTFFFILLNNYFLQNNQAITTDKLDPVAEDQPLITFIDYPNKTSTNKVHIIVKTYKPANVVIKNNKDNTQQQNATMNMLQDFEVVLDKGDNSFTITAYDNNNIYNRDINITLDNNASQISLITPSSLSTETYKSSVLIQFKITNPENIKNVLLNNQPINSNGKYNYQQLVNLKDGLNQIIISVQDLSSNTQNLNLTINKTRERLKNYPILMYHHILDLNKDSDYLSPQSFEIQLKFLKANNFTSETFQDLNDYMLTGRPIATHSIILSFDDGYLDAYTKAFPLLYKYGFKGSFGIIINAVGNSSMMNWDNLNDLVHAGMEIVSHSYTHTSMRLKNDKQLYTELYQSKNILENRLGIKVYTFIYPSGEFNDHVIEQLKKYGYESARTTKFGTDISLSNMYTLPTIRINRGNDDKRLAFLLRYFITTPKFISNQSSSTSSI